MSSNARNVSMGLAIVDTDANGALVAGAATQAGLLEALTKEEFKVKEAALASALVLSADDASIQAAADGNFQRLAYGVARIDSITQDGSTFIASAKATLKVVDLSTGAILYAAEKLGTGLGSDQQSARQAAFRQLGFKVLGDDLLSSLP